jgi:hypothetical protein
MMSPLPVLAQPSCKVRHYVKPSQSGSNDIGNRSSSSSSSSSTSSTSSSLNECRRSLTEIVMTIFPTMSWLPTKSNEQYKQDPRQETISKRRTRRNHSTCWLAIGQFYSGNNKKKIAMIKFNICKQIFFTATVFISAWIYVGKMKVKIRIERKAGMQNDWFHPQDQCSPHKQTLVLRATAEAAIAPIEDEPPHDELHYYTSSRSERSKSVILDMMFAHSYVFWLNSIKVKNDIKSHFWLRTPISSKFSLSTYFQRYPSPSPSDNATATTAIERLAFCIRPDTFRKLIVDNDEIMFKSSRGSVAGSTGRSDDNTDNRNRLRPLGHRFDDPPTKVLTDMIWCIDSRLVEVESHVVASDLSHLLRNTTVVFASFFSPPKTATTKPETFAADPNASNSNPTTIIATIDGGVYWYRPLPGFAIINSTITDENYHEVKRLQHRWCPHKLVHSHVWPKRQTVVF